MDWTGYNFYYTKDDETGADTDSTIKMTTPDGGILSIPNNPKNGHWQMYQQWLADGNTTQSE